MIVRRGDWIRWVVHSPLEIHTVTFPMGTARGTPFLSQCEGTGTTDTMTDQQRPAACGGDLSKFEMGFQPQHFGTQTITQRFTFGSSGILDGDSHTPFPNNYSFFFPVAGTFSYMCHVHDHMIGSVVVRS